MREKLIGLGLVLLLVVAGCSRKVVSSTTSKVTDSTHVSEVSRMVDINLPGRKVDVTLLVECDSATRKPKPKEIEATDGGGFVHVNIDSNGVLTASGGCDSLKAELEVKDRIIDHFRKEETQETKTETVVQYKTYSIDKFCRPFTGVSILVIVGYVIYKINKIA